MAVFATEPTLAVSPAYGYVLLVLFMTVIVCVSVANLLSESMVQRLILQIVCVSCATIRRRPRRPLP